MSLQAVEASVPVASKNDSLTAPALISPGTVAAAAGVAFGAGLAASWFLARRGKLTNAAGLSSRAAAPPRARAPPSRLPLSKIPAQPVAMAGSRLALRRRPPQTPPLPSGAAGQAARLAPGDSQIAQQSGGQAMNAQDAMRGGLRDVLDFSGSTNDDLGSAAHRHGPEDQVGNALFAMKALAWGTALAVGTFGVGIASVAVMLDAYDIPTFHRRMHELMGPRIRQLQEAVHSRASGLRIEEEEEEEEEEADGVEGLAL